MQLFEKRVCPASSGDQEAVDVALLKRGNCVGFLLVVVVGVQEPSLVSIVIDALGAEPPLKRSYITTTD